MQLIPPPQFHPFNDFSQRFLGTAMAKQDVWFFCSTEPFI
jgi:hypothetical protein